MLRRDGKVCDCAGCELERIDLSTPRPVLDGSMYHDLGCVCSGCLARLPLSVLQD